MHCKHGFRVGSGLCVVCEPQKPKPHRAREPRPPGAPRKPHSGLIDMAGKMIAGCLVIDRAPNASSTARWRVRAACGHMLVATGVDLRNREKSGRMLRCSACRHYRKPAGPGSWGGSADG